jgi:hypothetical protein
VRSLAVFAIDPPMPISKAVPKRVEEAKEKGRIEGLAAGAGAVGGGATAYKLARPVSYIPLDRRGQKVHAKLQRSKKTHVKLRPKDWASIAGGRGGRVENDAYTANMARALRKRQLPKGGTQVRVYGNTVKQIGGAHRAQASSMLGRRVRVEVVGRSPKAAPRLPALIGNRENLGATLQRQRLKETRRMGRRDINRLANSYTARAAKRNAAKSKAEDVAFKLTGTKRGRAALTAGLTSAGLATLGTQV